MSRSETVMAKNLEKPWADPVVHGCGAMGRKASYYFFIAPDGATLRAICRHCKREWGVKDRELLIAWASGFRSARRHIEGLAEKMASFGISVLR